MNVCGVFEASGKRIAKIAGSTKKQSAAHILF